MHFLPAFHFETNKTTPEWCNSVIQWYWYNSDHKSLLHKKKVREIEEYSSGQFDLRPFKVMFKSMKKALQDASNHNSIDSRNIDNIDTIGIDWTCHAAIPAKLNSAIAIVQKIPIEVTAEAQDPLAAKKKEEDLNFLKNKQGIEEAIQMVSDKMNAGKVDLGTTKHSDIPFSSSPYGLDLNEPDELDVFVNLLYSLAVETSFETILQAFWELKRCSQIKLLEITDQLKFGVSVHTAYQSAITGLPDQEYEYPDNVRVPHSYLPDFSDTPYRFVEKYVTAMELFNLFGDEIGTKKEFDILLNAPKTGYCACNKNVETVVGEKQWNSFKVLLVYCEVKSVDGLGIIGDSDVTSNLNDERITGKIFGQNTYSFYWLKNTGHFFGIDKLGYAYREKGREAYQGFSTNIYLSQKKSVVELAIGENKKIQIADIKLQHAMIKSLPRGKYIDLKYLRGALGGLAEETDKWSMQDLINLIMEQNVMVGDTTDFDESKNAGQMKPFQEIAGGMDRVEVQGYLEVIAAAYKNISNFTGINEALTGQSPNPDSLIGLEKLRASASINSLHYCNEAIEVQEQKLFNIWAWHVKDAIKAGGKTKKAIENIIGSKKVAIIGALDEIPLHDIGITISIKQREEERAEFLQELNRLKLANVISTADEFMLQNIKNPKDKFAMLAIRFKKWKEETDKQRQEQFQQAQMLQQQQMQGQLQTIQAKGTEKVKEVYAEGDKEAKIITLANSLGLNTQQFIATTKHALQQDRNVAQKDKAIATIQAKKAADAQEALPLS